MKIDAQNKTINSFFIKMIFVTQQIISDHNIIEISINTMSNHVIDYRFDNQTFAMRTIRFDDFIEKEIETIVILKWKQSSIWCRDCNDFCKRSINSNLLNAKITTWFFKSFRYDSNNTQNQINETNTFSNTNFTKNIANSNNFRKEIANSNFNNEWRAISTNSFFLLSNVHQTWILVEYSNIE